MNSFGGTDELSVAEGLHICAMDTCAERRFFVIVRSMQPPEPGN
jgi:hypothetical protein